MQGDDSQFYCGFVTSSNAVQEIIVFAREYCNVGRFINTVEDDEEPNCRAETVFLPTHQDSCEIAIIYVSRRSIKVGEELTVKYPLAIRNEGL